MTVFACARCAAVLTAQVSLAALAVRAHQTYGHELLPALMEPRTYAVEPGPSGPPWRRGARPGWTKRKPVRRSRHGGGARQEGQEAR